MGNWSYICFPCFSANPSRRSTGRQARSLSPSTCPRQSRLLRVRSPIRLHPRPSATSEVLTLQAEVALLKEQLHDLQQRLEANEGTIYITLKHNWLFKLPTNVYNPFIFCIYCSTVIAPWDTGAWRYILIRVIWCSLTYVLWTSLTYRIHRTSGSSGTHWWTWNTWNRRQSRTSWYLFIFI